MIELVVAIVALVVALGACGGAAFVYARGDGTRLRHDVESAFTAHVAEANRVLGQVVEAASDLEAKRRKVQGLLDKQAALARARGEDHPEHQQTGGPPDEMEAARQRLRARGIPFSG